MVAVNEALTRQIAHLARLELTNHEVTTFTAQLAEVLKYVEQLQGLDLSPGGREIEPLTHPLSLLAPLREDRVVPPRTDATGTPAMLTPAPEVLEGAFRVPPVL